VSHPAAELAEARIRDQESTFAGPNHFLTG